MKKRYFMLGAAISALIAGYAMTKIMTDKIQPTPNSAFYQEQQYDDSNETCLYEVIESSSDIELKRINYPFLEDYRKKKALQENSLEHKLTGK